jgi:N-acetylneuraminate synthase
MFIIAEGGINHNGDIDLCKKMITMAKGCGANAFKLQKRTVSVVYHKKFLDSPRQSPWGRTQGQQKRGLEFGWQEYDRINQHCINLDIPWFASAWDQEALSFIDSYHVPYHKIAGAMITNVDFLHAVAKLKKKTFISTAMCELPDVIRAVDIFKSHDTPIVLMHCVGLYPCPDDLINVSMIQHYKGMFPDIEIGYSGHETGLYPTIAAMTLGAQYIERHITLDRAMYGSDQAASIEAPGLAKLVEVGKIIEKCLGDGKKTFGEAEYEVAKKLRYWEK